MFINAIIAPEFIAVEGLQEWSQARKIVTECDDLTNGTLQLVHAFYIGMLALRHRTERGEKVIWPNQFQWLLEQQLVDWRDHQAWGLSKENIPDKSNADTTVKAFALLQVSWFVAESIMRAAHDLPLSQLESMTLSDVPLFIVAYFLCWSKPKDVLIPSVVELQSMSVEERLTFDNMCVDFTFDDEHTAEQDSWWNIWKLRPRVFEKEAKDKALEEMAQNLTSDASAEDTSNAAKAATINRANATRTPEKATVKKVMTENLSSTRSTRSSNGFVTRVRRSYTDNALAADRVEQPAVHVENVSSAEPTLVERAIRRTTTGLYTTRTTGIGGSSIEKKDRVLPHDPSETVFTY